MGFNDKFAILVRFGALAGCSLVLGAPWLCRRRMLRCLRRAASRAVEATNGPAVQSLTWTSHHHRPIFCWEKNRNRGAVDSKIFLDGNVHLYRLAREINTEYW